MNRRDVMLALGAAISWPLSALSQQKAVPVIGFYPAVVAVASVLFLDEKLSALQVAGVAFAVAGVVLIGAAG